MTAAPLYRPTPLEIASGLIFGFTSPESLPSPEEIGSPLEAFEDAILPALRRAPCLVSFSGGPGCSTVLAAAVRLARREGLELPVPATIRFPSADATVEREWQERVIVHLGLTEWARFDFDAELDAVGPVAMSLLRRHGLMAPFDVHFHMPLIDEACGGSLVTGFGGFEALGAPRWSRRQPIVLPWLRPAAQAEVSARLVADLSSEPYRWQDRFAWLRGLRHVRIRMDSLAHVAAALRVEVVHPFFDPRVAVAVGTAGMREFFGDLLPADILARRTASRFDGAFWRDHSRELAVSWDDDDEINRALVDADVLREQWSSERADTRTFLLLQSVALAREGRSVARQLAEAVGSLV